jgi:hypothetical protein
MSCRMHAYCSKGLVLISSLFSRRPSGEKKNSTPKLLRWLINSPRRGVYFSVLDPSFSWQSLVWSPCRWSSIISEALTTRHATWHLLRWRIGQLYTSYTMSRRSVCVRPSFQRILCRLEAFCAHKIWSVRRAPSTQAFQPQVAFLFRPHLARPARQ